MEYTEFLKSKSIEFKPVGFEIDEALVPQNGTQMFKFQHDVVRWALRLGKAAIFADCGLGKTMMQLQWAWQVANNPRGGDVLVISPLAVAEQTIAEGRKYGIDVLLSRDGKKKGKITITNYEQIAKFNPEEFSGVVLDESSILKSFDGKMRTLIIETFAKTPFKLACTATPSPNDYMELGNHAEFLGVMTRECMLSKFFFHDGGETSKWTIKGHAEDEFWKWIASWAVMFKNPAEIGYSAEGYNLPELRVDPVYVDAGIKLESDDLFVTNCSLSELSQIKKASLEARAARVAEIVNASREQFLVWCERNEEGDMLERLIPGAVQVAGSTQEDAKIDRLLGFASGKYRVLITKASIAGFGMNWQNCHNVIFSSVSHSYEMYYQAVRRCWRFGQRCPVVVQVVMANEERFVFENIVRKGENFKKMLDCMIANCTINTNLNKTAKMEDTYMQECARGKNYTAYLGDTCELIKEMQDNSVGFSIFSPPFASLYTYSNSVRDLGNCDTTDQFIEHFRFIVKELFRITKPGRLVSFHCMNLPTTKARDGFIGISDFRGELIRLFTECGWIYHSEVTIWKDPVTAMQRTKAIGLLHKQLVKDSSISRNGIPDYLVTMRKPGENADRIEGELTRFVGENPPELGADKTRNSIEIWQRYASPVWMDIRASRTLQKESAREEKDEKHICPLQLDVIERALQLWSKPGDLVFSPFMGIGSEGYCAVPMGRQFVGCELKESYFRQAVKNLESAERTLEASGDELF